MDDAALPEANKVGNGVCLDYVNSLKRSVSKPCLEDATPLLEHFNGVFQFPPLRQKIGTEVSSYVTMDNAVGADDMALVPFDGGT